MIKYKYDEILFIEITKNLKNHTAKINIYASTCFYEKTTNLILQLLINNKQYIKNTMNISIS